MDDLLRTCRFPQVDSLPILSFVSRSQISGWQSMLHEVEVFDFESVFVGDLHKMIVVLKNISARPCIFDAG